MTLAKSGIHRTRVPRPDRHARHVNPFQARCTCGWRGHRWLAEGTAEEEGRQHEKKSDPRTAWRRRR